MFVWGVLLLSVVLNNRRVQKFQSPRKVGPHLNAPRAPYSRPCGGVDFQTWIYFRFQTEINSGARRTLN